MKMIAQWISWLALAGIFGAACAYFGQLLDQAQVNRWLLGFSVAWFVATPIWMEHDAAG